MTPCPDGLAGRNGATQDQGNAAATENAITSQSDERANASATKAKWSALKVLLR